MTVIPAAADEDEMTSAVRALDRQADLNIPIKPTVEVVRSDDVAAAILAEAARFDLVVLGLRRSRAGRKMLGAINRKIASEAPCAVMLLSRPPAGADHRDSRATDPRRRADRAVAIPAPPRRAWWIERVVSDR